MVESVEVAVVRPIAVKLNTAAQMAEVSRSTLYFWIKSGKLKTVRVGADQRILVAELEEFLRSGRGARDSAPQKRARTRR